MKALVFLCLLGLGLASTHSLSKRSLLGRGGAGHHHHGRAHHHNPRQRQRTRPGRFGSRRAGRDGDHGDHGEHGDHGDHGDHHQAPEHPVRAISDGYLPAAADDYDYDNLAGYDRANQDQNLSGYDRAGQGEELTGYNGDQDDEVTERSLDTYDATTTEDYQDYEGSAAGDQYAAPSNLDNSYAAPEEDYGIPRQEQSGVDVARSDSDYSAPAPGDYSIPSESDQQYSNGNGFPFEAVEGRTGGGEGGRRQCPGGSIEDCVAVCPGSSVRVYGACVGGCADRCPDS